MAMYSWFTHEKIVMFHSYVTVSPEGTTMVPKFVKYTHGQIADQANCRIQSSGLPPVIFVQDFNFRWQQIVLIVARRLQRLVEKPRGYRGDIMGYIYIYTYIHIYIHTYLSNFKTIYTYIYIIGLFNYWHHSMKYWSVKHGPSSWSMIAHQGLKWPWMETFPILRHAHSHWSIAGGTSPNSVAMLKNILFFPHYNGQKNWGHPPPNVPRPTRPPQFRRLRDECWAGWFTVGKLRSSLSSPRQ